MANATVIRLRMRSQVGVATGAIATEWLSRGARTLRSVWCTLNGGHYRVLHTEPDRLSLKCVACGNSTPGWDVSAQRPAPRYAGDPERHRLAPHRVRR
jgi:hypothetical protein